MSETDSTNLAHDLFNIIKQFPRFAPNWPDIEGITRSEFELLVFISINQDEDLRAYSVSQLGKVLHITPAAITHLINPLEDLGYLERFSDKKDRRIVLLRLTEKGKSLAENLIGHFQNRLAGLINHLGEEDSKAFIRIMKSVFNYFQKNSKYLDDTK